MKQLLLQLHLYGGLFCAVYLIVFGLSSLHMNHHFSWMEPEPTSAHWEQEIVVPKLNEHQPLAEALRDSLGLFGWTPWWHFHEVGDTFRFQIEHFGKEYKLLADRQAGRVEVEEIPKGFWPTFNSLHFLGGNVPRAPWLINSWQYYQDLTVIFIVFSIVSGVYLWSKKRSERRIGWWLLGGITGLSCLLMLYLWLVG